MENALAQTCAFVKVDSKVLVAHKVNLFFRSVLKANVFLMNVNRTNPSTDSNAETKDFARLTSHPVRG